MTRNFTGKVRTKSGAEYEFKPGLVRRINPYAGKRADGEWVRLISMWPVTPVVDECMLLTLEPLDTYGPDDTGHINHNAVSTTRRTTTITHVEAAE